MTTRYTKDHEWVRMDGDIAVIGITNHAAGQLGDVVFVELPAVGKNFSAHADMAVVESVKAASDVYAPIGGTIVEINQAIVDEPARVNADPESGSWFVKMKPSNKAEFDALMDAAAYKKLTQ